MAQSEREARTPAANELCVETREVDDVWLVAPRGFINAHTVRLFEDELRKALARRRYKIVVDCAQLLYIASAGLGAIMGVIEEIRRNGGDLRLASLRGSLLNVFEILGFTYLYRIFPSEREAVASFAAREGSAGSRA